MIEFGLVNLVLSKLLSPLLARGGGALERAILNDDLVKEGGTDEQRLRAYEALRGSCVELRTVLQVLQSLPRRRLVAIISLPLRWRLINRLPELSASVNDAFLAVAMVGRRETVEAAATVAERLRVLAETGNRTASGPSRRELTAAEWTSFDEALSQFVSVARLDLGLRPLGKETPAGQPS